ncbi:MAG: dTDP-4-dehydrorhamnose reductase [Bacteroidales bacterium]|nr:dTDP-4-dehydrorhamnose reductase [Bacteroidales bacterium]
MNVLVTGANGQLGHEIRNASAACAHRFIFTDVSQAPGLETVYLDITNIDAIRIICASEDIDVIVNCAAYTDVEKAESDISFADLLNHTAAANLAEVACERKATLIHISTDYVFDGEGNVPYRESDVPSPLGAYGVTKFAGERSIMNSGCKYLIFRTAWLYSPYGRNFVKTMARLTGTNETVRVVFDQTGTPTYAADLAAVIVKVISDGMLDRTGIYHFSDEGCISWYDLAVAVGRLCGHACRVLPCHTDEFPTKTRRPKYSVLDKTLVKDTFGIEIPYWYDSLVDCIQRLQKEG